MDSLAVTMLIRGILIITPTDILYGRTSVIRSPIITAPRTPATARGPTTAIIELTTAIKANVTLLNYPAENPRSFSACPGTARPVGFDLY